MHRSYVDAGWGQIHLRSVGDGPGPALFCLHATAYSGRSMATLQRALSAERRVVAIDTPGYGASDGPNELVPFEHYATAIGDAIERLRPGAPVDLFGYHTGALLATELAVQRPALIRRIVLIGVPFFPGPERAEWRARLVHETTLQPDLDQFRARWNYLVTNRPAGLSLHRGFDNFVDELSAYPREWFAHHALFDYDAAPRLRQVTCPTLVINPDGPLAAASRQAAALIPHAQLFDYPPPAGAALEAAQFIPQIQAFLASTSHPGASTHFSSLNGTAASAPGIVDTSL